MRGRNTIDRSVKEEDEVVVRVQIDTKKHPAPKLPPQPQDLTEQQVSINA